MDKITIVFCQQRVTQRNESSWFSAASTSKRDKNSESVSKTLLASATDDKVRAWIDKNFMTQPDLMTQLEVCRLARLILSSFSCACSAIAFC